MKRKKSSECYKSSNKRYHSFYSNSTKDLTSWKAIKRPSSQWFKNNNLDVNSYEYKSNNFPGLFTSNSFYNKANLYLNKNNYIIKPKNKKLNKYFEKEQLFDRVLRLQKDLNSLNQKYTIQKIENTKQSKEIIKQNKFLNMININNLMEKSNSKQNIKTYNNYHVYHINKNTNIDSFDLKEIEIKDKFSVPENISIEKLKAKYTKLAYEYEQVANNMKHLIEENEILRGNYDKIKIANETLISNLKMQCKNLEKENESKNNELIELKKTMKFSTFNELTKEKEVYEKEMIKMKKKLSGLLKKAKYYKSLEEKINQLNETIKKKDFKIKLLEVELKTLSNNLDKTVQKFEGKIIIKDKIIKKKEREIKLKKNDDNNNINNKTNIEKKNKKPDYLKIKIIQKNKTREEVMEANPEFYRLYIEMKQKGINSEKIFINNVLKNLEEMGSLPDNKIIFIESIINLFNIEDKDDKGLIMDFADKEFVDGKRLLDIKNNEISIFDTLFNKNDKILKNSKELKEIIASNKELINKMKNLFEKYDKNKNGFISFNEMIEVIKEMKLENIKEELLLISKSEIFNRMDYYNIIVLAKDYNNSVNNANNEDNKANL